MSPDRVDRRESDDEPSDPNCGGADGSDPEGRPARAHAREVAKLRPYSDFIDAPNIVLLGEPGAGKSYLFKEAAVAEGGRYVKVRELLVTPPQTLSGKTLFIDALDEKRSGRTDRDVIDALVEKLFAANPTKVRLSCRVADWLGESDLAGLLPYFAQTGGPAILLLQSLSPDEQRRVLATPLPM